VPNSYRLTEVAAADLDEIAAFTIEKFGVAQARQYANGLFRALDLLVAFRRWVRIKGMSSPA
jgi:plasmid stabilization system protein ParE